MKTYLQKFLIVEGFEDSSEVTVRTSKDFFEEEKKYVGLSILRRGEQQEKTSFTPMPPGVLFMGDPSYDSLSDLDFLIRLSRKKSEEGK